MARFKRILLKLSGESLMGKQGYGIDPERLADYARQIKEVQEMGVQIGIVIGGGNIFRGLSGSQKGFDRVKGDQMGMCATVINSLALQDAIEQKGVPTRVQTALNMVSVAEPFILRKALRHFELGRIVIFACGTGNPYCSTDTGAALRACEINADILLLAKNVDGIYDDDPKTNPDAKKIDRITHMEVINRGLKAMDTTAITMCMDNDVPVLAFALSEKDAIVRAIAGEQTGTLITNEN